MEFLQRKVLLGGIIGLIVISLIFVFFLYIPKIRHTSKVGDEINSLRRQIKENEAMAKDLGKLRAQVEKLENDQREFMAKVIPRSEMLSVVRELVNLGEPYQLIFSEIQPPGLDTVIRVDNPDSPLQPAPFIFTVQGKYLDIAQYLESLKDFPYFIRIPEIEIIGKDEIRPMIEARILVNLYVSSLVVGGTPPQKPSMTRGKL